MSGMEVLANEIQMYLEGSYLRGLSPWETIAYLVALCLICYYAFSSMGKFDRNIAVTILLIGGYVALTYILFLKGHYFPIALGILAVFVPFCVFHVYEAVTTFYEKEKIRNIFSKHIDRSIVAKLIDT
jgi:CHASE2 domain-containing sensor protein